jgi:hypothetical protein
VKEWYLANGLLLNASKSEVILSGMSKQLCASSITHVSVAGANLPIANEMKTLGLIIDSSVTFEKHVAAVAHAIHQIQN